MRFPNPKDPEKTTWARNDHIFRAKFQSGKCSLPFYPKMSSSSSSSDSEHSSISKRPHAREVNEDDDSSDSAADSASSSSGADTEAEDVPVLSHAEKRRQKKKDQKQPASTDEKSVKQTKIRNTAELAPSKVPKRQNSVWVGNLAFKTTPQSLRQFFDGVGEITRIHMPMKMTTGGPSGGAVKENRGLVALLSSNVSFHVDKNIQPPIINRFAYVDFATADAKTVATTLSENHLDGRRLLIKDGV